MTEKNMNRVGLGSLWDDNKRSDIHIIRFPEESKQWGPEGVLKEIVAENFLNLARGKTPTDSRNLVTSNRISPNKSMPRHHN